MSPPRWSRRGKSRRTGRPFIKWRIKWTDEHGFVHARTLKTRKVKDEVIELFVKYGYEYTVTEMKPSSQTPSTYKQE